MYGTPSIATKRDKQDKRQNSVDQSIFTDLNCFLLLNKSTLFSVKFCFSVFLCASLCSVHTLFYVLFFIFPLVFKLLLFFLASSFYSTPFCWLFLFGFFRLVCQCLSRKFCLHLKEIVSYNIFAWRFVLFVSLSSFLTHRFVVSLLSGLHPFTLP